MQHLDLFRVFRAFRGLTAVFRVIKKAHFNKEKPMTTFFDDTNIKWQTLGDFEHLHYAILDIDEHNKIIDVIFKFSAHQQILLHRHKALNKTFVIQGEHRLYEADGRLKEVRAVGSYTSSLPSDEPHREGGGDVDVIVLFSIRGSDGVLYEILDDDFNIIGTLGWQDLVNLYKEQTQPKLT